MNTETANENNPGEQSQDQLAKVTKPQSVSTEDDGEQNKSCSPLDLDENPVNRTENHCDTIDIMLHSDQVLEKGSKNEAAAAEELLEDSKINVVDQQLASDGRQNNIHFSRMEKALENTAMETSVCNNNPCISIENVKKIPDLQSNVKTSENTGANSSEEQNLPESKTKQICGKKVEKEAKQQKSYSDITVGSIIGLNLFSDWVGMGIFL